jgi:hypothetical protein
VTDGSAAIKARAISAYRRLTGSLWLTFTPHGPHSKTLMVSFKPRQIVRTCAMGFPHVGQGIGCESFGAMLQRYRRGRKPR